MTKREDGATEAPTPRRIERAWREGGARISAAAPAAAATVAGMLVLLWGGGWALTQTAVFLRQSLVDVFTPGAVLGNGGKLERMAALAITTVSTFWLPVAMTAVLAAALASLAQTHGRLRPLRLGHLGWGSGPAMANKLPLLIGAFLLLAGGVFKIWNVAPPSFTSPSNTKPALCWQPR
jgi:hypothetical protein